MEIACTNMHTCGMNVRVIESGFPSLTSTTLLGKFKEVSEKHDKTRSLLMTEPRGDSAMYGALICDSELKEADLAVLFMDTGGLSSMCGHVTLSLARYAVDKGIVKRSSDENEDTKVVVHAPCGLVNVRVSSTNVSTFTSVLSFVQDIDVPLTLGSGESIKIDVSYGGAFYAVFDCTQLGIDLSTEPLPRLIDLGAEIKKLAMAVIKPKHPESEDLGFFYGTVLTDGMQGPGDSKTLIIFADRQVDRSPCGSGTTARLTVEYYKKKLLLNEYKTVHHCKVPHSAFVCRVVEENEILLPGEDNPRQAVRVEVSGKGYYTGTSKFIVEPDDLISLDGGFLLK